MRPRLSWRPGRIGVLFVLMFAVSTPRASEEAAPPALKAAFLLNFAKFAEWPREVDAAGPLALCVLHDHASEDALAQLVSGASINGRPVTVARSISRDRLRSCHVAYLGPDDALDAVLADLRMAPVLTVGDGELFARHGGVVGLLIEGNKMRFVINPGAALRNGLRLSSKLLALATLVHD